MRNAIKSFNIERVVGNITRSSQFSFIPVRRSVKKQIFNIDVESLLWLPDWYIYWKDTHGYYQGCNDATAKRNLLPSRQELVQQTDYSLPIKKIDADQFRLHDSEVIRRGIAIKFLESATFLGDKTKLTSIKIPLCNDEGIPVSILALSHELQDTVVNNSGLTTHIANIETFKSTIKLSANNKYLVKSHKTGIKALLSERQIECAYYLLHGYTFKEIAKVLMISPKTVEKHIDFIKAKLGYTNRSQLIKILLDDIG